MAEQVGAKCHHAPPMIHHPILHQQQQLIHKLNALAKAANGVPQPVVEPAGARLLRALAQ